MCTLTCMTTQELLESFTAVHTDESIETESGGYLDWSTPTADGRVLEVGEDGVEPIQLRLSHTDLLKLHAALTLTLIRDAQEG